MRFTLLALPLITLAACGDPGDARDETLGTPDTAPAAEMRATAMIRDAAGRDLGAVAIVQVDNGLRITGALTGMAPGDRAIHFHTTGACTPDFEAAGPHWNPSAKQHGMDNPSGPHAGDLPNMSVGADSAANIESTTREGRLTGDMGLMDHDGAAVVVHMLADDNKTDPDGNSGARVACGVVEAP
jgi:Cu-Zn family superoxide dismutase